MRSQMTARAASTLGARGKWASLIFVALVLAGFGTAATASGATVYRPSGEKFAKPGSGAGEIFGSGQIAVDQATGYVLVSTRSSNGVFVYAPDGSSASYAQTLTDPELNFPVGLAIDQGERALYLTGQQWPDRQVPDRRHRPAHVHAGPRASPARRRDRGPAKSAASSRCWPSTRPTAISSIADSGNQRVSRFTSDGAFVSSFDGADSPAGAFHRLSSIAVDGVGATYVVDVLEGELIFEGSKSVIERFGADGAADPGFNPEVETPRTIGIDPSSGNLIAIGRSDGGYEHADKTAPYPIRMYVFRGDQTIDELDFLPPTPAPSSTARGGRRRNQAPVRGNRTELPRRQRRHRHLRLLRGCRSDAGRAERRHDLRRPLRRHGQPARSGDQLPLRVQPRRRASAEHRRD